MQPDGERLRLVVDDAAPRAFDEIALDRLAWTARGVLVPVAHDGRWWMLDGSAEQGPFDAVGAVRVAGMHHAFAARLDGSWRVHTDTHVEPPFDAIEGAFLLDGEYGSVAYEVVRGASHAMVHDGSLGPPCTSIALATLGAKGAMLAYVDDGERDRLLVDHAPVLTPEAVLELVVADEAARWAALVAEGDATLLVRDGTELARRPLLTHLRLSADGGHVACLAPAADGLSIEVLLDGSVVAQHRRVDGARLAFAADGRLVFVFEDSQGVRLDVAGHDTEHFDEIDGPAIAGARVGWVGRRGGQSAVFVEGETIATEEWAGALQLAERGEGWAYVARRGDARAVVTPRGRWPVPRLFVDTLVLDGEGRHWGALVPDVSAHRLEVWVDGAPRVVLDERELATAILLDADRTPREVVRGVVEALLARDTAPEPTAAAPP